MGLPQVRWMVEAKLQQVPWLELDPERHPSSECSKEWCRPRHGASESTHTYVYWLVVYLPLWKNDGVRQLGLLFSTEWKNKACSKPPTRSTSIYKSCWTSIKFHRLFSSWKPWLSMTFQGSSSDFSQSRNHWLVLCLALWKIWLRSSVGVTTFPTVSGKSFKII